MGNALKFAVKFVVRESSGIAHGESDCGFHIASHEWGCSSQELSEVEFVTAAPLVRVKAKFTAKTPYAYVVTEDAHIRRI